MIDAQNVNQTTTENLQVKEEEHAKLGAIEVKRNAKRCHGFVDLRRSKCH